MISISKHEVSSCGGAGQPGQNSRPNHESVSSVVRAIPGYFEGTNFLDNLLSMPARSNQIKVNQTNFFGLPWAF